MPQIPSIDASYGNQERIGGVNINNPEVRDVRYAAKAQKYEKISNILEKVGSEYQQKWERKKAVERQLTASKEQMNASIAGDQLLQDAQNLPDDEVMPFITQGMEKINNDAYKKYGGDQEMWGQVSLNIQRSALETQHKGFNFIQERAKDTALASFVEQEAYITNKALTSKDPNIEIRQLDEALDSLTKAGYMDKATAAKISIDKRSNIMTARISHMISNDNFTSAAATLDANRSMIPLNAQASLENSIESGRTRIANHNAAVKKEEIARKLTYDSLLQTDPAAAAYMDGINPQDKKAVANATQNRAVFSGKELKSISKEFDKAKTATEFVAGYAQLRGAIEKQDPTLVAIFDKQMEETLPPETNMMIELSKNGATEQLNLLFESRKQKAADLNAVTPLDDVKTTVDGVASSYLNWMKRNRSSDEVTAYYKDVKKIAQMHMLTKGSTKEEAVKFATSGTADTIGTVRVHGMETVVPVGRSAPDIAKGLETYAKDNIKIGSDAVYFDIAPDRSGYLVKSKSTNNPRVRDNGQPYFITPVEAEILGAAKNKEAFIKQMNTNIEAWSKEMEPAPKRKAAPLNSTD